MVKFTDGTITIRIIVPWFELRLIKLLKTTLKAIWMISWTCSKVTIVVHCVL